MNKSFKTICNSCIAFLLAINICANAEEMPKAPVLQPFQELLATELEKNKKYIESKISQKDGKTTYFFDKDGEKIDKK
ncbi:MAG: hypothetical protein IJ566_04515 [Cardiobacteriaceae bacterium]|nr:hypothetical protein [Cardiobacteriaceae bacterium]